jgi:2-polyprenyl-3-methyl-5-hydroxy-6-metoxy-1,4-benzoquinol methylase
MSKNKIKLQLTKCPICQSTDDYQVVYEANFKLSDFNVATFSARRLPDKIHYRLVKCKHDGLVRSNPIIEIKQLDSLYQKSQLTYESSIPNLVRSYYQALVPVLNQLNKSAQILEIGCGNGFMLNHLSHKGYKNVWGVEPSHTAAKQANSKLKKRIIAQPFSAKLFQPNSFDLIFLFQTLDHLPQPDQFLADCYQLLKKNGRILTFNHDINSISAKILGEKSPIIDIEHTHLYSQSSVQKLFQSQGFLINRCYSPMNWISLRYLIHLLPINVTIKQKLLSLKVKFFDEIVFPLKLGNLCLIAQK